MSDYSSLKATINANVKANNNQEITGTIMNSVLNAMVNSLGAGYQFIGVATPTNPGSAQTPDYKCFYLATTPGTYTNLGGLVVADGEVAILKYDTSWTKEVTGIATAESVSQLGQDIGKIYGGRQLFSQYGSLDKDTGANKNDDDYYRTPLADMVLLPVEVSTMSLIGVGGTASSGNALICFYDSSKTFISSVAFTDSQTSYNVSIPSGAVYFRVSSLRSVLTDATKIIFGDMLDLFIRMATREEVALKADKQQADANTQNIRMINGVLLTQYTNDAIPTKTPNGYWGVNGSYYTSDAYRTTIPIKVSVGDYVEYTAYGSVAHIIIVSNNGDYIHWANYDWEEGNNGGVSFDFDGYIVFCYRAAEGLTYKLWKSSAFRELADYAGFKGTEMLYPNTKTPNGYWGTNGVYYETNNYRTSVPIEVKIGDKLIVTAAGNVSLITRTYQDGRYMSTIQAGSDSVATYNYVSTFNGYLTISWRAENNLAATITRANSNAGSNGSLGGVKWGAMGDSLTDPITLSGQPDTRNYVDLIAEQTGIDVINYGKSGSGYKAREAKNEAFYQVALNVASDLDVITIFGSGNDQNWVTSEQIGTARDTGTDTLCGCMNTAIDNLISVNPLIRIGLVTPSPWKNYPPDSTTATWMKIYSERIVEVAALRGIPCLDLYHDSNLRPWNASALAALYIDNTHPNTEGHKRIASQIKAFLIEMAG